MNFNSHSTSSPLCNGLPRMELEEEDMNPPIRNNFLHGSMKHQEMATEALTQQIAETRQSLFLEGFLNDYFLRLEELEEDNNPNFLEETVTLFLQDSSQTLASTEEELQKHPVDFTKLDFKLIKLKGGGSTIGAKKFTAKVIEIREHCQEALKHNWNIESLKASFLELKQEHRILQQKLESYLELRRRESPVFPS